MISVISSVLNARATSKRGFRERAPSRAIVGARADNGALSPSVIGPV